MCGREIEEESEDNEEEDEVWLTDENQSTIEEDDAGSFLIGRLENELAEKYDWGLCQVKKKLKKSYDIIWFENISSCLKVPG